MRPRSLEEVVGQEHLTGEGGLLREALARGFLPSLILWGPPGSGKTTLARLLAETAGLQWVALSAVFAGVKEVREVIAAARDSRNAGLGPTLLFMDEVHRFNRSQQDAFLGSVEEGLLVLVGATTENPSFSLNAALLSRCRVLVLQPLPAEKVVTILQRALHDTERGFGTEPVTLEEGLLQRMAELADGDARYALNLLESLLLWGRTAGQEGRSLGAQEFEQALQQRAARYDREGEAHYDLISALHKALRGSDCDAALYWLARMFAGGEDGLYIARRLIRFASEDVGNADPQALPLAMAAREAFHFLGKPEGELALAQVVVYLATAPKSNSVYVAYGKAQEAAKRYGSPSPPLEVRNAPTRLMKELGYGAGYRYAHDYEHGYVAQEYLPANLRHLTFYTPVERGFEREIARRMAFWQRLKTRETEGR
ncbi:MAG: replication-associated recombination protein A [Magnetococcales bacterium]|nr:replication-associated recombination protein A [Magnetococcales bacterium]